MRVGNGERIPMMALFRAIQEEDFQAVKKVGVPRIENTFRAVKGRD